MISHAAEVQVLDLFKMTGSDYEKIDLDVLQEEVLGGMSRYQLLLCIGVAFLSFSTAPCTQLGIYFSAVPEKR